MAAKGYTTRDLVAAQLGSTFTAAQEMQADLLIESAEAWIDRYTDRAWGVASIVGEKHLVPESGWITLEHRPVTAITSVSISWYPAIGGTPTPLVDGTSYQLLDATEGLLYLGEYWYEGYLATVSYTAPATIPASVRMACTLLVAHWMRPAIESISEDVSSYSIPGEISVTYRDAEGSSRVGSIPSVVLDLLGRRLVFA